VPLGPDHATENRKVNGCQTGRQRASDIEAAQRRHENLTDHGAP
jgi:hypothetical protein